MIFQEDIKTIKADNGFDHEDNSALECIYLGDPAHEAVNDNLESKDDIISTDRTEFEYPDVKGNSKKKNYLKSSNLEEAVDNLVSIGREFSLKVTDRLGLHNRRATKEGKSAIFVFCYDVCLTSARWLI